MKDTSGRPLDPAHFENADESGTLCGFTYGSPELAGTVIDDDDEIGDVTCEQCQEKLLDDILARAKEAMPAKVTLVYLDYRDQLSDKQVASLLEDEDFSDPIWDFEGFSRNEGVEYLLKNESGLSEAEAELLLHSGHYEEYRELAEDRDDSNMLRGLARQTPAVLLRIRIDAIDEDHAYSHEEVDAAELLGRLGLEASEENLLRVQYALDNASPEYSTLMGYWIVGADVEQILDLPQDGKVEIVNPYLYLGNPFMGDGFITEDALTGIVTVDRSDIRTDKSAFGYGVNEIYGGLNASQFEAELRPVVTSEATDETVNA